MSTNESIEKWTQYFYALRWTLDYKSHRAGILWNNFKCDQITVENDDHSIVVWCLYSLHTFWDFLFLVSWGSLPFSSLSTCFLPPKTSRSIFATTSISDFGTLVGMPYDLVALALLICPMVILISSIVSRVTSIGRSVCDASMSDEFSGAVYSRAFQSILPTYLITLKSQWPICHFIPRMVTLVYRTTLLASWFYHIVF